MWPVFATRHKFYQFSCWNSIRFNMRWWWHEMQAVTPTFCYELYPGWCRHLTEKEKVKKKISYLVLNDITIYWWYGVGKTCYNSNHTFHALIKLLSSVTKYLLKFKNASDEIQTSKPTIWEVALVFSDLRW